MLFKLFDDVFIFHTNNEVEESREFPSFLKKRFILSNSSKKFSNFFHVNLLLQDITMDFIANDHSR